MAVLIRKILFWCFVLFLALGSVFFILSAVSFSKTFVVFNPVANIQSQTDQAGLALKHETIKLVAVGDIMLDRGVDFMVQKQGAGDFKFPFLLIKPYLDAADLVFGNLESVISDQGQNVGSIFSFRAKPEALQGLVFAGFNVVNLAHNHAFDYTSLALQDTMARLTQAGIVYIGAGRDAKEAFGVKIEEVKGVKIGFLGYTNLGSEFWRARLQGGTGLAWIDRSSFVDLRENIRQAKSQVDLLVVSLHSGNEYQTEPTLLQQDFAHLCIDNGADLVLEHHSHVVQPTERYKQGFVAYGLGNFIFDQGFSVQTMQGLALEILIENKIIKQIVPRSLQLNQFFQPSLQEAIF